jgi:hypothetical protein
MEGSHHQIAYITKRYSKWDVPERDPRAARVFDDNDEGATNTWWFKG